MASDHTGVRVTSTPDCGLICGFVKTVTFGFWSPPLSHKGISSCLITAALILCIERYILIILILLPAFAASDIFSFEGVKARNHWCCGMYEYCRSTF